MHLRPFLIILSWLWTTLLLGQRFPVEVMLTSQMNYPGTVVSLSDDIGGVMATLILRDAAAGSTQVRLRFIIESRGVRLLTRDDVLFPPITLESNIPLTLMGFDLQHYFLPDNFDLSGITREDFIRSGGGLPEGFYEICVEVLDFQRLETPISDRICTLADMDVLDPPLITSPYDGQQLDLEDASVRPHVDLSWLMNYSTTVFPIGYYIYLYEYDSVSAAFGLGTDYFARQPFFSTYVLPTTLALNQYIFGIQGEVEQMKPGATYVMRVQAIAEDRNVFFRNGGFSDPVLFRYGSSDEPEPSDCEVPVIRYADSKDDSTYLLSWQTLEASKGYDILLYDMQDLLVDSIFTQEPEVTLTDIHPDQRYRGFLLSHCSEGDRRSEKVPFYITLSQNLPTIVYNCGAPSQSFLDNNRIPITQLLPGDTIVAGDFLVRLSQVEGSGGSFSGSGQVVWNFPFRNFLNPAKDPVAVNINFQDIKVNTEYFMYDGHMEVQGVGVNLVPPVLSAFLTEFGELDFVADDFKDGADQLEVDFQPDSIVVDPFAGTITIWGVDDAGNTIAETTHWDGADTEITGSGGSVFTIDEEGNVRESELAEGGPANHSNTEGIDPAGYISELSSAGIRFTAGGGIYSFDDVAESASENEKSLYPLLPVEEDGDYRVPFKAVVNGETDVLTGVITDPSLHVDSLVFMTKSGRKIEHRFETEGTLTLQVEGLFSSVREEVLAVHHTAAKQQVVGVFYLLHLAGIDVEVVTVPLGNAEIPANLEQALEAVYGMAGVNLAVSVSPSIPLPPELLGTDQAIETGNTSTFANYTAEQQAINSYIRQQLGTSYNPQAYYILISDIASSTDLAGYMPLQRQYGYLFADGQTEVKANVSAIVAHELGHGIFALEHPFSKHNIPLGSTDWLMDYSDGTALPHIHWAQINDPEFRLYAFQEEEEGAQIVANEAFLYSNYIHFAFTEQPGQAYAGLTPSGQRFVLPNEAVAAFYPAEDGPWPQGSLAGFRIGNTRYFGWWNKGTDQFYGYAEGYQNDMGQLKKQGSYMYSLSGEDVPVFTGRSGQNCLQQIWWHEQGNITSLFSDSSHLIPHLAQQSFALYEEATIPPSPCGCYQGECQNLLQTYEDHLYLQQDNILRRIICANPCVLQDMEPHDFFQQPTSEWMEDLNNTCAYLLAFGFTPAVLAGIGISTESLFAKAIQSIAAQSIEQITLRFSIGSAVDMLLQTYIYYYFAPEDKPITWDEAKDQVNLLSVAASGIESIIVLESKYGEAAVSAAVSCFVDGNLENGKVLEGFDLIQCAQGAFSALAFHGILGASSQGIKYLRSLPPNRLVAGFHRFFQSTPPGTFAAGLSPDGGTMWTMLRHILPDPLAANHVKALFRIEDDRIADLAADALASDPAIRTSLLENGFFQRIYNFDMPSNVRATLIEDLIGDKPFRDAVVGDEGLVRAWERLFRSDNLASAILRRNPTVLSFLARYDIEIDQAVIDDVYSNSNYPLKETVEDVQGRLTLILSRPSDSHKAITIQRNSSNDFISTVYSRAYNPDLNPSIPVPVSANRLVPDYLNTHYMHPLQGTEIVKIRLSGNRDIDFARARQELGISLAEEDATNYVWHHMDDFDEVNGEAYCTMQLVRREAHNGTGVTGMQHSGSAAQWRAYYESGY